MNKDTSDKPLMALTQTCQRVGIAADHGGYELKEYLVKRLREAGHEVIGFGDREPNVNDDYPDFVVPLARAVAAERWSAAWPSVAAGLGPRSARTKSRGCAPA